MASIDSDLLRMHEYTRDGEIKYPSGNKLSYTRIQPGEFHVEYGSTHPLSLETLLPSGWNLVLSSKANQINIREDAPPEAQFDLQRLEQREITLLAGIHEIGHARHFEKALERAKNAVTRYHCSSTRIEAPELSGTHGQQLKTVLNFLKEFYGPKKYLHCIETTAWDEAFQLVKEHQLLSHLAPGEQEQHARNCLLFYGIKQYTPQEKPKLF